MRPRVLTHLRGMGEVVRLRGKSGDGTPDGRHTPPAFHGRPTGLQGERQHRRAWRAAAPCMMATCGGVTFAARSSTAKLGEGQSRCRLAKFSSGLGVEEGIERCRVSDLGRGGQRQHMHMHMHMPPPGVWAARALLSSAWSNLEPAAWSEEAGLPSCGAPTGPFATSGRACARGSRRSASGQ